MKKLKVPPWQQGKEYQEHGELAYYINLSEFLSEQKELYPSKNSGYGILKHATGEVADSVYPKNSEMFQFQQAMGKSFKEMLSVHQNGRPSYPCTGGIGAFNRDAITIAAYPYMIGSTPKKTKAIAEGIAYDLWHHRKNHHIDPTTKPLFYAFLAVFIEPVEGGSLNDDLSDLEKELLLLKQTIEFIDYFHKIDKLEWDPHCGNDPLHHPEEFRYSFNGEGWFWAVFSQQALFPARKLSKVPNYPQAFALLIDEGVRFVQLDTFYIGNNLDFTQKTQMVQTIRSRHEPYGSELPPLLSDFGGNATFNVNGEERTYSELWDIVELPKEYLDDVDTILQEYIKKEPFGFSNHATLLPHEHVRRRSALKAQQGVCPFNHRQR